MKAAAIYVVDPSSSTKSLAEHAHGLLLSAASVMEPDTDHDFAVFHLVQAASLVVRELDARLHGESVTAAEPAEAAELTGNVEGRLSALENQVNLAQVGFKRAAAIVNAAEDRTASVASDASSMLGGALELMQSSDLLLEQCAGELLALQRSNVQGSGEVTSSAADLEEAAAALQQGHLLAQAVQAQAVGLGAQLRDVPGATGLTTALSVLVQQLVDHLEGAAERAYGTATGGVA